MRWRRGSEWSDEKFNEALERAVRAAAAGVIAERVATLESGVDGGGAYLALKPANPRAAEVVVYFDGYPTVAIGGEHTTEMFGSEEERLEELRLWVEAVIAGRFEWRYDPPEISLRPLRFRPVDRLQGTFHTTDGPRVFNRYSTFEESDVSTSGTYEPYRRSR